jgi:hypothetical protein
MGFGEAFRIEHQSDHDLLAVRALIARILDASRSPQYTFKR